MAKVPNFLKEKAQMKMLKQREKEKEAQKEVQEEEQEENDSSLEDEDEDVNYTDDDEYDDEDTDDDDEEEEEVKVSKPKHKEGKPTEPDKKEIERLMKLEREYYLNEGNYRHQLLLLLTESNLLKRQMIKKLDNLGSLIENSMSDLED